MKQATKDAECTQNIMCKVATYEKKRLYLLCAATLPTLVVLFCVTAYSTHNTISRVRDKNIQVKQFVANIFEETYKGTLGLGIGSLALFVVVANKTKIVDVPSRFKESQKYISN